MLYELYHVRYKIDGRIENVRVRAMSNQEAWMKVQADHPGCIIVTCTEGFD